MTGTVLVTGFEPFDGFEVNPSAEVARFLDGQVVA
ncbi:MAG: pyroglutamyl-peptidase I family protein, partial [Candidatus Thorarchaeota archaeon]